MEKPFEVIIDKRTAIENTLYIIGMFLGKHINDKKKKRFLITDEEAQRHLLKTQFHIDDIKNKIM